MRHLRLRRCGLVVVLLASLLVLAATLYGAVRIGGHAFSVNNQLVRDHQYMGGCPVDLKFDWGVVGTHPTTITYSITRSDGRQSSRAIRHPGGNRSIPIVEHWRLGANNPRFGNYRGWMQIDIQSPDPASNRIDFTLHCR